jgi:hypothetical protein
MLVTPSARKIVLLGLMTKMPVAGVVWQVMHYLIGFQRLGYDVYYVEEHGVRPSVLIAPDEEDALVRAAGFINGVMTRFGLGDKWAYHAVFEEGAYFGLGPSQLARLYDSADLIINLHGGTVPRPEHWATDKLLYLETDPVELQVELHNEVPETVEFLRRHFAFFTFGENYGREDCELPKSEEFTFHPTRQPVVLDFWQGCSCPSNDLLTTIGNWRQPRRKVRLNEKVYFWTKDLEFQKLLDLPRQTEQRFELALSSIKPEDRALLEEHGWRVTDALSFSMDIDAYQDYIDASRGEFTVAKDQNVRLRSGWFSDRSATYLAAGRPVITQETGFSNILPTGRGLFAFQTIDDILAAIDAINSDYDQHSAAAREIAEAYFSHEVVLGGLLEACGHA